MTAQAGASFGRRCLSEAFANYALVACWAKRSGRLHRLSALADAALLSPTRHRRCANSTLAAARSIRCRQCWRTSR
jgi:hypothetical protein